MCTKVSVHECFEVCCGKEMYSLQFIFTVMFDWMLKHGILTLVIYSGWSQNIRVTGISRSDVITRAQFWTDAGVPYSQSAYHVDPNGKKYRTDCSGFVSMAWNLSTSLDTTTLPKVSTSISKEDLKEGDIILKSAGENRHVVIFEKWTNDSETHYWTYEETGSPVNKAIYRENSYPYRGKPGYSPYRYNNIIDEHVDTSASANGPCKCPENYYSKEILQQHYGDIPAFCGYQLSGLCNHNQVYICAYYYHLPHPTPTPYGSICPFGCTFSKYINPHCKLNQAKDISVEREQRPLAQTENTILFTEKKEENTSRNAVASLFLYSKFYSLCWVLFSKTLSYTL